MNFFRQRIFCGQFIECFKRQLAQLFDDLVGQATDFYTVIFNQIIQGLGVIGVRPDETGLVTGSRGILDHGLQIGR